MSSSALQAQRKPASPPMPPWIPLLSYAMVVFVFICDWIIPDPFVIDIAYEGPVVFAVLKGSPRLTSLTVALGSAGIVLGWYVDLANASFHFSEVRSENRLLSIVSLLIVGTLANLLQRHAQRASQLEDERAVGREASLSAAIDRVMGGLSPDKTIRAVAGVAPGLLGASAVVWCPVRRDGELWVTQEGTSEAKSLPPVQPSESFSAILQHVCAQRSVEIVSAADSIDHLSGKPSGSGDALAIPVGTAADLEGVVFAVVKAPRIDLRTLAMADNFAKFATAALQQARLIDRLDHVGGQAADASGSA